jgi:hypothetical protein
MEVIEEDILSAAVEIEAVWSRLVRLADRSSNWRRAAGGQLYREPTVVSRISTYTGTVASHTEYRFLPLYDAVRSVDDEDEVEVRGGGER